MKNQTLLRLDPIYQQSQKSYGTNSSRQPQNSHEQQQSDQILQILNHTKNQQQNHLLSHLVIPNNLKIQKISCGFSHFVTLTQTGSVLTAGNNQYNQLGYQTKQKDASDLQMVISNGIKDISCGRFHTVAYNQKQAFSWGEDRYGALGYEKNTKNIPRKIPFLLSIDEKIRKVYCGANNTIIKVNQSLYGFGDNSYGKLGLLIKKNYYLPELLEITNDNCSENVDIIEVIIHEKSIALLTKEGKIFIAGQFGMNKYSFQNGFSALNYQNPENEIECDLYFSNIAYLDQNQLLGLCKKDQSLYRISELKIQKVRNAPANIQSIKTGNKIGFIICENHSVYSWTINNKQHCQGQFPYLIHLSSQNNISKNNSEQLLISTNQNNLIFTKKKKQTQQKQKPKYNIQQSIQLEKYVQQQTEQFSTSQTTQYKQRCLKLQAQVQLYQEQIYQLKQHFREELKQKIYEAQKKKQLQYLELLEKKDSIIQKFTEHFEEHYQDNEQRQDRQIDIEKPMENIQKCLIHLKMIFQNC